MLLTLPYCAWCALLILLLLALLSYTNSSISGESSENHEWVQFNDGAQRWNRRNLSEWNRSDVVKVRRSCREALVDGQETADFIKVNEDLWLVGLRKARSPLESWSWSLQMKAQALATLRNLGSVPDGTLDWILSQKSATFSSFFVHIRGE